VTGQTASPQQVRAKLTVSVKEVPPALTRLHALLATFGAEVTQESSGGSVQMTVRLPPQQVQRFLDAVAALGEVTYRETSTADVRSSLAALARRRPSQQAQLEATERAVKALKAEGADASQLEATVPELRALLAQDEEEQERLEDAVARAWVDVGLTTAPPPRPSQPELSERDILFRPGARVSSLFDVGSTGTVWLWGLGLSLQPKPWLTFEAEFFRAADALSGREGADALLFSVGLDATSRLFGRGKRRFFNPHLGLRVGVSASFGRVDAVTGVSAGVELVHAQRLVVDVQLRALGQWGNRRGAHLGVQPGLTVATAW